MNNLSNIELHNAKMSSNSVQQMPDESILQHANVLYKHYSEKGTHTKGWHVYNYRCNYCTKALRSTEMLAKHLEVCPGLEDDYVPKPKRRIR